MKRTRVRQFVERLTAWRNRYGDLRHQPFMMTTQEISIEDFRSCYPRSGVLEERSVIYRPLEIDIGPWPGR